MKLLRLSRFSDSSRCGKLAMSRNGVWKLSPLDIATRFQAMKRSGGICPGVCRLKLVKNDQSKKNQNRKISNIWPECARCVCGPFLKSLPVPGTGGSQFRSIATSPELEFLEQAEPPITREILGMTLPLVNVQERVPERTRNQPCYADVRPEAEASGDCWLERGCAGVPTARLLSYP